MAKRASLRASDADRERVAERLKQAATEGRILAQELEERLAAALRARTYGDLDAVVSDLPGTKVAQKTTGQRARQMIRAQPVLAVAIFAVVALVLLLVAAVVIASLFAFAGVWILVGALTMMHRGSRYGGRPPRGPWGGPPRGQFGAGPRGPFGWTQDRSAARPPRSRLGGRDPGGAWRE